jgi:murein DD-endopeptidase MepM/ murein hydrolase activator NlpD
VIAPKRATSIVLRIVVLRRGHRVFSRLKAIRVHGGKYRVPGGAGQCAGQTLVQREICSWLGHIVESWHQSFHGFLEYGTDFYMPYHTPVYAVEGGPVLGAGYYGGGGVVSIQAAPTTSEYYQHLSDITVSKGQLVDVGELIGYSGGQIGYGDHPSSPNYSGGPHLEWGINAPYGGMWHPLGANINPVPYLIALLNSTSSPPPPGALGSDPSLAVWPSGSINTPGQQDVFWKGSGNNGLWEAVWNNGWHGPSQVPGPNNLSGAPTAVVNPARSEEDVYWRGTDGQLWEITWTTAGWGSAHVDALPGG